MVVSFGYIVQQILNGLILGSIYSLVALGFSLIYSILGLVNFAHGDIMTVGAFAAIFLSARLSAFSFVIVVVVLIGCVVGVAIERIAFRPIRTAPQLTGFITSLAVSSVLQNLGVVVLSPQPRTFRVPEYFSRMVVFGSAGVQAIDILIILLTAVLAVSISLFVRRTKMGVAIRATAENVDVARLMGIDVNRVVMVTFAMGSALAALAGVMWGGKYGQVDPLMGFTPGLKAFVAAVIGGVGSLDGAMLGGVLLGLSEVLLVGLLPPMYSGYRDSFVFGFLLLILLLKPAGLLGGWEEMQG